MTKNMNVFCHLLGELHAFKYLSGRTQTTSMDLQGYTGYIKINCEAYSRTY